jgi:hypothetical protein
MLKTIKVTIQDNDTGKIFEIKFQTIRHAEAFVHNERISIGKNYEIKNISEEGI